MSSVKTRLKNCFDAGPLSRSLTEARLSCDLIVLYCKRGLSGPHHVVSLINNLFRSRSIEGHVRQCDVVIEDHCQILLPPSASSLSQSEALNNCAPGTLETQNS